MEIINLVNWVMNLRDNKLYLRIREYRKLLVVQNIHSWLQAKERFIHGVLI